MSETKKVTKSKEEKVTKSKEEKIGLDGVKLWEVATGSPAGSSTAPNLTDMGELGQAPPVPHGSLLKVTEELKKAAIVPPGAAAPNPILNPILETNVV